MITDELKQKNYDIYKAKLEGIGVNLEKFEELLGDKVKEATYTIENNNGLAYNGSLLQVVLRMLTPYAIKINEMLPETIKVDKNSLVKVCLLQHLAKAEMFIPNTIEWQIKQGKMFMYNPKKIALRLGMRSVALALELGVELNEIELEALTIIDKDSNDEQSKIFANPISVVVRQANEWVTTESVFGHGE